MKYYSRYFTKREAINRYGKLGYVGYVAYVKTNNIDTFNKRLKNRFVEIKKPAILIHAKANEIIEVREELSSVEAYFRKPISKGWRR